MKKFILISISFLFLSLINHNNPAFAYTIIPEGNVSGTWTESGSPYMVQGNIEVASGEQLMINPGVEVIFQGTYFFEVYGSLIANGNSSDSIYFKAQNPSVKWRGILFTTESSLEPSESSVKFCRFENVADRPGNERFGAVKVKQHEMDRIENCWFQDCEIAITLSAYSPVNLVQFCRFDNISGPYIINVSTNQLIESFDILQNKFYHFQQDGIIIEDNRVGLLTINIGQNEFVNTTGSSSRGALIIDENDKLEEVTISGNRFEQVNHGFNDVSTIAFTENNSTFDILFTSNRIENCGYEATAGGGALTGGVYADQCHELSLQGNTFIENQGFKAGAAYIVSNRLISDSDTFTGNVSFFFSGTDETGNGGSILYESLGQQGVVKISGGQFSQDHAERYAGSVYLKITNDFDSVELKNNSFTGEFAEISGGAIAVLLENNINYTGILNNTFTENKAAEYGGCIWIYTLSEVPYLVGTFESDNNDVYGDDSLDDTESYIYYSAFRLPENILFNDDHMENIRFGETFSVGNRVIHFEDRSNTATDFSSTVNIRNSQFTGCNRGIFYFSTRHEINEILLHQSNFNDIESDSTAALFVKANQLGEVRVEAGTYEFLSNELSHGGAIYLSSNADIEKVLVQPFNDIPGEFNTCFSEGSGGILYAKAGRLIGQVEIMGASIEDCYADGNGGNFYFESVAAGSLPQSILIAGNTVDGPNWTSGVTGGYFYYTSPDDLEHLEITGNQMGFIKAGGRGGAFYIAAADIGPVTFRSNYFDHITAETDNSSPADGGMICLLSDQDIESIRVIPGEDLVINVFEMCESEDNGGCIYAKANGLIGTVEIDSANFSQSHAGKQGGSIYIESSNLRKSNRAQSLSITNSNINGTFGMVASGLEGGFLYYLSPSNLESLTFSRNTFHGLMANSAGGAIYVNAGTIGPLDIESNLLNDIMAEGKGGGIYLIAGDIGPVSLTANECNQVEAWEDNEADGGVFFIHSNDDIESISLASSDEGDPNTFTSCRSKRSGGCLFANAAGWIGEVQIRNTEITDCYAGGDGGAIYIKSGDANAFAQKLNVSENTITGAGSDSQTGGAGGFLYFQSPAPVDSLAIHANTIQDVFSAGNGGAFSVSVADINHLGMLGNTFQNLRSVNENGGVLYLQSAKDADALWIVSTPADTNRFLNCFAGTKGGAVYTLATGLVGELKVTGTEFTECYAGSGGGSLFLESDESNSALSEQTILISDNQVSGSAQAITSGDGGFLAFITPAFVSQLDIIDNVADGLRTNGAGGFFSLVSGRVGTANVLGNHFTSLICPNPGVGNDGGAIYITSEDLPVANLFFEANTLEDIHGFSNGGALNIAGKGIQNALVSNNTWKNITARNYGGMACFYNSSLTGTLNFIENTFEIAQTGNEKPVKGGALYVSSLDSMNCSDAWFTDLKTLENGGAVSMENTIWSDFNQCVFRNCEAGMTGGAIHLDGDSQVETFSVRGSNLYHNSAHQKGGGIYLSQIDNVFLGEDNNGNIYSVNQNFEGDECKGGAVYASQVNSFTVYDSKFYGNSSMDGGGIYLADAAIIDFDDNILLGNIAFSEETVGGNGGAFRLHNVASGEIKNNGFQSNTSDNHGGAIDIFNEDPADTDTLYFTDNYFYKNNSREGGAILANYPMNLKRNLFTENECRDLQPPAEFVGSAISMYGKGVHSAIYNCVFDYNLSENPDDGSVYFRLESMPSPYTYPIQNCTFLNGGNNKAIFSENNLWVVNSLFQNYVKSNKFEPEYFNDKVTAFYCDLVFADIWENNNYDSVVSFTGPNCYSVSCDQPVVDNGDPDPVFFDNHFPPACDSNRNDIGVTGGPHNPDLSSVILCEPNDTLSVKVDAYQDCDMFTFKCTEGVGFWDMYTWYLPNNQTIINNQNEITVQLDLPPGEALVRLLVEDTSMSVSQFGFGIRPFTVKELRIGSLEVTSQLPGGDGKYEVNNVPHTFQINATLLDKPEMFSYSWIIEAQNGIVIDTVSTETGLTVTITEIDPGQADIFFIITYAATDEYCEFTVDETLRIDLKTNCQIPSVTFTISEGKILTCNDSISVHFSQKMIHSSQAQIDLSNITDIYTLVNTDNNDVIQASDYNIYEHDPTGIIFYLDSTYLCNHVGNNLLLTIKGDMVMTEDCKIRCSGNPGITVPITVGIAELGSNFLLYPNPTRSVVYIQTGHTSLLRIDVYNILGEKLVTAEHHGAELVEVDMQALEGGIYFIHLTEQKNGRISSFRVIKE